MAAELMEPDFLAELRETFHSAEDRDTFWLLCQFEFRGSCESSSFRWLPNANIERYCLASRVWLKRLRVIVHGAGPQQPQGFRTHFPNCEALGTQISRTGQHAGEHSALLVLFCGWVFLSEGLQGGGGPQEAL